MSTFDVKASKKVFKAASLMGPRSGLPTSIESDESGKITRVRPIWYEDYIDWDSRNPWKVEAKGKAFEAPKHSLPASYYLNYKKRVYSNNRVRYPLKRVDWDPNGDRHPENRGKSKFVRISWDEATTIIAQELVRLRDTYGMESILAEADMHGEGKHIAPSHGCMNKLLSLMGGYTVQMRNQDSWEGYSWGSKNVWGGEPVGEMQPSGNLWPDIAKNCDQLLFWAADPETTSVGFDGYMASRLSQWIHSLGMKFVYVDPALNFSGCYLSDKWIPLIPNTDAALYLGVIYVWLKEGLWDKEYVESHAVGYDEFFSYVLGEVDGEPKDPEWASKKSGVPIYTIKALARNWHEMVTSVTIGNGGPGIRGPFSSEPARLQSICLAMQGLGKHGRHQAKWLEWNLHTDIYPMPYQGDAIINIPHRAEIVRPPQGASAELEAAIAKNEDLKKGGGGEKTIDEQLSELQSGEASASDAAAFFKKGKEEGRYRLSADAKRIEELAEICAVTDTAPQQSIPKCLVHDAILKGHVEWYGLYSFCGPADEQWIKFEYPRPGCSRIHGIWTDSPCMTTCWNDSFNFVKAVRDPSIEFIVAQQPWLENDCYLADIVLPVQTKFEMEDVCDDTGGAVFTAVFHERPACPPVGESLNDFDCVAEVARKISMDLFNKYTTNDKPLDRVVELFWQGCGVAHLDKDDEFHKNDIFILPCRKDVQDLPVGLQTFAEDPENHPLTTPTGKLEFTSTGIKENFPDDEERPPYPKWIEASDYHDERFSSPRAKKYPLMCMSNHGRWRFHANCDDITWSREVETHKIRCADGYQYEPAWINPVTAAKYGIKHHDIVKVYNERGTVLCAAYLTERVYEDTVYVDHGARFDPIDAEGLDRGGAINLITPHAITSKTVTGMVVSGFLVAVEPVTQAEMDGWKKKYPDSFARKVDDACGVCLDGWLNK